MSVKLVIDSASDLGYAAAQQLGVTYLPMSVRFGEQEYRDGIDLSPAGFYEKLVESSELPATSQVTPHAFEEAFSAITADGDTVLAITISSKLSGTYNSAVLAAAPYGDQVQVVDSLSACIGEQILIRHALQAVQQGRTAADIAAELEALKSRVCVLALLDTLTYLQKGGRISAATAFAGSLLSIKPVVTIDDGEVSLVGKARGSRNGNNLLMELVGKAGGIDFSLPYVVGYSGLDDTLMKKYIADSAAVWAEHTDEVPTSPIGSTIGTHVGPGTVAVAFFASKPV